ncbi:MurR/RpiR family transcriptional regulator [Cryobacterium frigoriphilum]|uniref:MurR/RpiR family transcriptional regulator n=1 Tax=Cryobacterium frigoriphilum TaxID=1259150 RepID=A0A4R8ZY64_9MICO|nr:MurR/RpiR family transcriptional regulator [Cryobacterium frigoriphilum]TFD48781.1 MurR/RpiR family transcriptional regulator [Cryobacterium frigoriphilum]
MGWTGNDEASPSTRVATVINSLQPTERRVAECMVADMAAIVELTAQELAQRVGVARSTVIRTCQTLGYRGYPQLRVALARELAQSASAARDYGTSALGHLRADVSGLSLALPQIFSVLTDEVVEEAVHRIATANRVLALASGLSAPLASDLAMRLTAVGRPAEFVADPIGQQISARQLRQADVCIIISGSGANESSIRAARSARAAQAAVVVVTSFASSPLVALADVALVVAAAQESFRHELEHTSRVPHAILIESLVAIVSGRLGEASRSARSTVLGILSDNLSDD